MQDLFEAQDHRGVALLAVDTQRELNVERSVEAPHSVADQCDAVCCSLLQSALVS